MKKKLTFMTQITIVKYVIYGLIAINCILISWTIYKGVVSYKEIKNAKNLQEAQILDFGSGPQDENKNVGSKSNIAKPSPSSSASEAAGNPTTSDIDQPSNAEKGSIIKNPLASKKGSVTKQSTEVVSPKITGTTQQFEKTTGDISKKQPDVIRGDGTSSESKTFSDDNKKMLANRSKKHNTKVVTDKPLGSQKKPEVTTPPDPQQKPEVTTPPGPQQKPEVTTPPGPQQKPEVTTPPDPQQKHEVTTPPGPQQTPEVTTPLGSQQTPEVTTPSIRNISLPSSLSSAITTHGHTTHKSSPPSENIGEQPKYANPPPSYAESQSAQGRHVIKVVTTGTENLPPSYFDTTLKINKPTHERSRNDSNDQPPPY